MKVSLNWIREFVRLRAHPAEIAERLTLAGIEAETEALPGLSTSIVVGRIDAVAPHPQADRLRICTVEAGQRQPLTIVCGAANAAAGMKAPTALAGTRLPDGTAIKVAAVRGVESAGMLCSAAELGLAEGTDGLLALDDGAEIGAPVAQHLALDDALLTLELTPNRGDCLSVRGLARELAAVYGAAFTAGKTPGPKATSKERRAVKIDRRGDCSAYAGRMITGIVATARTPDWMRERLRRSGLRCIHPVVDITHYVMLELGQPLHAFDAAKLHGGIRVRRAAAAESLRLLDGTAVTLTAEDLVIADDAAAVALAGVMGGADSAVSDATTSIFFESACFDPTRVAATGRRLRLASDALHRFERGVDPGLQRAALERATALVLQICGGAAGPVTFAGATPKPVRIALRRNRLRQLLGHDVADREVERLLTRLGIGLQRRGREGWRAEIPSHRYDLRIEVDLIEEVARLHGYDRIPARPYTAALAPAPAPEGRRPATVLAERLVARGYQEVVTYSFVDPGLQRLLAPQVAAVPLDNPMAETMGVMRTSLWPGLIGAWRHNRQRQRTRIRIFESGICFFDEAGRIVERPRLAGLVAGAALPEQWGAKSRPVDFFDLKGDLEALFGLDAAGMEYRPAQDPALHPGRSAYVLREGRQMGSIGALHPALVRALDLPEAPLLFELDQAEVERLSLPQPTVPPEFPSARRDLALVLAQGVPAAAVLGQARAAGGAILRETFVFDVYQGAELPNGSKSIALGLIFQDNSRTLTDLEVETAVNAVQTRLREALGASVRT